MLLSSWLGHPLKRFERNSNVLLADAEKASHPDHDRFRSAVPIEQHLSDIADLGVVSAVNIDADQLRRAPLAGRLLSDELPGARGCGARLGKGRACGKSRSDETCREMLLQHGILLVQGFIPPVAGKGRAGAPCRRPGRLAGSRTDVRS